MHFTCLFIHKRETLAVNRNPQLQECQGQLAHGASCIPLREENVTNPPSSSLDLSSLQLWHCWVNFTFVHEYLFMWNRAHGKKEASRVYCWLIGKHFVFSLLLFLMQRGHSLWPCYCYISDLSWHCWKSWDGYSKPQGSPLSPCWSLQTPQPLPSPLSEAIRWFIFTQSLTSLLG